MCYVAQDIDFTDLLGCSDYDPNGLNLFGFVPFPLPSSNPYVNEKFYLDHNVILQTGDELTLNGCIVAIAPDNNGAPVKIELDHNGSGSPPKLFLNNDVTYTHLFACSEMWKGIIVKPGGKLEIDPITPPFATKIEDAIIAVESNGGTLKIGYAKFDHNLQSIYLHDNAFATSYIKGTSFKCTGGVLAKSPGYNHIPNAHIQLENATDVTIGGTLPGNNDAYLNTFEDAENGIKAHNSFATVINNNFSNLVCGPNLNFGCATGINAYNDDGVTTDINIGGATTDEKNTFTDSESGIIFGGPINTNIQHNDFGSLNQRAININDNAGTAITIDNNTFTDVFTGNFLGGITRCLLNITANTFTRVTTGNFIHNINTTDLAVSRNVFINTGFYPDPYINFNNTAITVQNPSAGNPVGRVNIFQNNITDYRIGIHAANIPGINIGMDAGGNIFRNRITFNLGASPDPSIYYEGIWLQNCDEAKVMGGGPFMGPVNFDITNDLASRGTTSFIGIDVEKSRDCRINCNGIANLPYSMKFYGHCDLTTLKYNNMAGYVHGVHMASNAVLPSIMGTPSGGSYVPYDNQWAYGLSEPPNKNKIWNNNPNLFIDWYFQGAMSFQNSYYPLPANQGITAFPTLLAGNDDCSDVTRYQEREASIGRAVKDSLQFDENANENMYQAKMDAFNAMTADTTLIYQGKPDDYVYENFVSDMSQGNMGLFQQVDSALADSASSIAAIESINNSVNDTNNVEIYLKTVNTVYLNTVAVNVPLSATDTATLYAIAYLPVSLAGSAVYMAAAMLGLEVHQAEGSELRKAQTDKKLQPENAINNILIYPNPANESLHITGFKNETGDIKIYDMQSRMILSKNNVTDNSEIGIKELANGIYRLNIKTNSNKYFEVKFSVIK